MHCVSISHVVFHDQDLASHPKCGTYTDITQSGILASSGQTGTTDALGQREIGPFSCIFEHVRFEVFLHFSLVTKFLSISRNQHASQNYGGRIIIYIKLLFMWAVPTILSRLCVCWSLSSRAIRS